MKSSVFLHVFNDISIYAYLFPGISNIIISNLTMFDLKYYGKCNIAYVAVINILK